MVQFIVVNDAGVTLCRLTLGPTATLGQLLQQVFLVRPEARATTRAIRNEARRIVCAVNPAVDTASQQTLQAAQLTSQNAAQETLVLSSNMQPPVGPGVSSVPIPATSAFTAAGGSHPQSSSSSGGAVAPGAAASAAAARILELFGGAPAAASARQAAPSQQQQVSVQPPSTAVSGVDSGAIDPALLDPAQAEMQRRLYEYIQQQQIDENLANALEYTPEAFARVIMLYVPCTINQVPIKAFVDSGAQMSIMNRATAERCGLMRLVDKRMRGVAVGVGRQEILGRIHMAPVNLSGMHIPFSFSVIAEQDIDLIIGLDQLKRHQMVIDLKANCLVIDSVQVPFLSESDIPKRDGIDAEGEEGEEGGEVAATTTGAEEDDPTHAPQQQPMSPASPAAALPSTAAAAAPATLPRPSAPATASSPEEAMRLGVQRGLQVESFMEFTGLLDYDQARALLEAADWDPDVAGAMYFDA